MKKNSVLRVFIPFRGYEVRRLTAAILVGVALPRLPFWPGPPVVYPLRVLPQEVFGWMTFAIAVALIATLRHRYHWQGRGAAVLAFATWMTLAFATTSVTSMIIDCMFAYAMLGEITAQYRNNYDD